jgi:hypothetical protein
MAERPGTPLILKQASVSRPSGQWRDADYDVICEGAVVGRVLLSRAAPQDAMTAFAGGARARRGAGRGACEVERRRVATPFGDAQRPASEEFPALIQSQLVSAPESLTKAAGHSIDLVVPQQLVTAVRR